MSHQKLDKLLLHIWFMGLLSEELQRDRLVLQLLRLALHILQSFEQVRELLRLHQVLVLQFDLVFPQELLEYHRVCIRQHFGGRQFLRCLHRALILLKRIVDVYLVHLTWPWRGEVNDQRHGRRLHHFTRSRLEIAINLGQLDLLFVLQKVADVL